MCWAGDDLMKILKKLIRTVINLLLGIWSHFPIICLSDDDNFANVKIENIRKSHLRISLLNVMLGDNIVYVLSYDLRERKFSIVKVLQLVDIKENCLEDEEINLIQDRFKKHIAGLSDEDLEIEKEKLLYHIEQEEQRINTSIDKINIYATIILTVIPIVSALIDFKVVKELPVFLQVMIWIAVYALINICIYIFRTLKVRGIKKSRFSDLRESTDRKKEIVVQYQYDWQQLKYKAQLFVSFVLNLQEWIVFILILIISISFGISIQNQSTSQMTMKNAKSTVFTLNEKEIDVPYSNSAVDWQSVVLDIEKKKCEHLIILSNGNGIPKEINALNKYKDLKIEIVIDGQMDEDIFKLVEVK